MAFVLAAGYSIHIRNGMAVGAILLLVAPTWSGLFIYFQSRHWLRSVAVVLTLSLVLLLGFTIVLLAFGSTSLVAFLWPSVAARSLRPHRPVCDRPPSHAHSFRVRASPMGTMVEGDRPHRPRCAIGTVYFRIDAVMLSQLDDLRAVGLYGIAYKFSHLLVFLPTAIMAPTFTLLVVSWPAQPAVLAQLQRCADTPCTHRRHAHRSVLRVRRSAHHCAVRVSLRGRGECRPPGRVRAGDPILYGAVHVDTHRRSKKRDLRRRERRRIAHQRRAEPGAHPALLVRRRGLATVATELLVLGHPGGRGGRSRRWGLSRGPQWSGIALAAATMLVAGLGAQKIMPWEAAALLASGITDRQSCTTSASTVRADCGCCRPCSNTWTTPRTSDRRRS